MKRTVIIGFVLVAVLLAVAGVFRYLLQKKGSQAPPVSDAPIIVEDNVSIPDFDPTEFTSENSPDFVAMKFQKEKVTMKNFLRSSHPLDENNFQLYLSSEGGDGRYEISYYKQDGLFRIMVYGQASEGLLLGAEQRLLGILGIDEKQACNLSVFEGAASSEGEPLSGYREFFSFCPEK